MQIPTPLIKATIEQPGPDNQVTEASSITASPITKVTAQLVYQTIGISKDIYLCPATSMPEACILGLTPATLRPNFFILITKFEAQVIIKQSLL